MTFSNCSALEITAANSLAAHATPLPVGLSDHYRLDRALGAGGMGEVYLAVDDRTNRKVALKLLPDYFNKDSERVHRFRQEAEPSWRLNHPRYRLAAYEVGDVDGVSFIASEFIEGETLPPGSRRAPGRARGKDSIQSCSRQQRSPPLTTASIVHATSSRKTSCSPGRWLCEGARLRSCQAERAGCAWQANPNATSPGMLSSRRDTCRLSRRGGIDVDGRSDLSELRCRCFTKC